MSSVLVELLDTVQGACMSVVHMHRGFAGCSLLCSPLTMPCMEDGSLQAASSVIRWMGIWLTFSCLCSRNTPTQQTRQP